MCSFICKMCYQQCIRLLISDIRYQKSFSTSKLQDGIVRTFLSDLENSNPHLHYLPHYTVFLNIIINNFFHNFYHNFFLCSVYSFLTPCCASPSTSQVVSCQPKYLTGCQLSLPIYRIDFVFCAPLFFSKINKINWDGCWLRQWVYRDA